ncbi:GyrI-like domain-containing protein [Ulvibacterium marinum]|uniref:GyrI-like domain-containing protein n=1 Tax=Ulvibacterium marinum TaxID=2419782 RepID=UPI0024957EB0|nr:GyrI-like domain-containing protein [Ulvibacterium marinum]
MKHEWRKKEKKIYLSENQPELVEIPEFKFLTIEGEGSPQNKIFAEYIGVLYSVSYAIKMNLKKEEKQPSGYCDYTVYPLEGIWDITEEAKKTFKGTINKNDLIFKLMIRQPSFVTDDYFLEMLEQTKKRKPHSFLEQVTFEKITDGKCVQMMHIGSYDDEPQSFKVMEDFAEKENFSRISKDHREIYLTDFRKVAPEKLKTVLRFKVEPK